VVQWLMYWIPCVTLPAERTERFWDIFFFFFDTVVYFTSSSRLVRLFLWNCTATNFFNGKSRKNCIPPQVRFILSKFPFLFLMSFSRVPSKWRCWDHFPTDYFIGALPPNENKFLKYTKFSNSQMHVWRTIL